MPQVKISYNQKPYRRSIMQTFGAQVTPSPSMSTRAGKDVLTREPNCQGSLGTAISEAIELARTTPNCKYTLGSVLNHVTLHQTIIGLEAEKQMEMAGEYPDTVIACFGGGSNFGGIAFPFMRHNILEGKKLPVYGDGSNVRDWLYVEDHCKAIEMVVRKGRVGQVYNVGGHNEKTNIDIVRLTIATIHRLMTEQPEYRKVLKKVVMGEDGLPTIDWINDELITFVKDRLGHDQRYAIDPTKIKEELGWYPETCFEVGIVKTIEWYLNNQAWVEEVTSGDYQHYYERMYAGR